MTTFCIDAVQLDRETAACVKGMLARGDAIEDIAVWFGLSVRVVQAVRAGAVHPFLGAAPSHVLPRSGPYKWATVAYRALEAVQKAERELSHVSLCMRKICEDAR
jgi:hypothetical protein